MTRAAWWRVAWVAWALVGAWLVMLLYGAVHPDDDTLPYWQWLLLSLFWMVMFQAVAWLFRRPAARRATGAVAGLAYWLHPNWWACRLACAEWSERWRSWPHCNGQARCWMHVSARWCDCRCRWCRLARTVRRPAKINIG